MPPRSRVVVRPATRADRELVAGLFGAARWQHQHLDWEPSLDLLGRDPFLLELEAGEARACLACPEDPPGVAWVRVFAVHPATTPEAAWGELWPDALRRLAPAHPVCAALSQNAWMQLLLRDAGFRTTHSVLFMEWRGSPIHGVVPTGIRIVPLSAQDVSRVESVDRLAFAPLWQHSERILRAALDASALATAAVDESGALVGYSLSTLSALGGHVARLAVVPAHQGRGVGRALMADVLREFSQRRVPAVSVNTQSNNVRGRSLYRSLGFEETGQIYPVFELTPDG